MSSFGAPPLGETAGAAAENDFGVVDAERRLRQVGHLGGIRDLQPVDVLDRLDQRHLVGRFAQRADDFVVVAMPDQHDRVAFAGETDRFQVHLANQRTGGVDHVQVAAVGFVLHVGRNAVGAVHQMAAGRHFVQPVDEHDSLPAKAVDHVPVVDDFVVRRTAACRTAGSRVPGLRSP